MVFVCLVYTITPCGIDMDKQIEDYMMQLEKRIIFLEGRVAMLESNRSFPYTNPGSPGTIWGATQVGCSVCGPFKGAPVEGFVCSKDNCPTKITC